MTSSMQEIKKKTCYAQSLEQTAESEYSQMF